jgi:hypothetical protein
MTGSLGLDINSIRENLASLAEAFGESIDTSSHLPVIIL